MTIAQPTSNDIGVRRVDALLLRGARISVEIRVGLDAPLFLPARLTGLTAAIEPATAAAIAARSHRLRLINGEAPSPEFVPVERGYRATGPLIVIHLDEGESARLSGGPVTDDVNGGDRPSSFE
ncbi:MAG TPA: hypothetical protein VL693_20235 [Vicinamibacterales bacterium]|nr:hypothetical protein [Vicinamibacterales bacterium]